MNTKTLLSSSDVQCKPDTCSHMCLPGKNGPVCLCPNGLANQKICAGMSHSNICLSVFLWLLFQVKCFIRYKTRVRWLNESRVEKAFLFFLHAQVIMQVVLVIVLEELVNCVVENHSVGKLTVL
jgi:hypothetical protein